MNNKLYLKSTLISYYLQSTTWVVAKFHVIKDNWSAFCVALQVVNVNSPSMKAER